MMLNIANHQGDAPQNPVTSYLMPVRVAFTEKRRKQCWRECGEKEILVRVGNVNCPSTMKNNMEFLPKIKKSAI